MLLETLRFTFRYSWRRPLRTSLTLLQVAVATWAIATILSSLFALRSQTQVQTFDDIISVESLIAQESNNGRITSATMVPLFNLEDVTALPLESPNIKGVALTDHAMFSRAQVGEDQWQISSIQGASGQYADMAKLQFLYGYYFTEQDVTEKAQVIVISDRAASMMYPDLSKVVGSKISLLTFRGTPLEYTITGVFKHPQIFEQMTYQNPHFLVPLGSGNEESARLEAYQMYVQAEPGSTDAALKDADTILHRRHGDEQDFRMTVGPGPAKNGMAGLEVPLLFLGALALIALFVSSIGIFSIMLVSVVERTREMALRRSLGAARRQVIGQLVLESTLLSLAGALLGLIVAAVTGPWLLRDFNFVGLEIDIAKGLHPLAALIAAGLVAGVGGIFGLYPAFQGAAVTPVEGLREGAL